MLTAGLFGGGRIGQIHAENMLYRMPLMRLKTLVDPVGDTPWLSAHSIHCVSTDPHDIFSDPDIDCVLICSPSDTHAELIMRSIKANKSIFCEKPLSSEVSQIVHILDQLSKTDLQLQVGFNRIFDPTHCSIIDRVKAGAIGDPHLIHMTSYDPDLPSMAYVQQSGGLFFDMSIHDFHMAEHLAQSVIVEVSVLGDVLIDEIKNTR